MSDNNKLIAPPIQPFKSISRLLNEDYLEEIEGDMGERFHDNLLRFGEKKARFLYTWDSFKLLKPGLMKKWEGSRRLNQYGMFKHQLKITWRQAIRQKSFSLIKLIGFAIGLAACILIALYVKHQTSYDQHYTQGDRIFRVANKWADNRETGYWTNVHGPLKELLEDNIPDIAKVSRVVLWSWADTGENHFRLDGSAYNHYDKGFFYADPEILEILEVPMIYGSQSKALLAPNSIVISKKKADQYFPGENPIGQRLVLNNNPKSTYIIGGVMDDFPTTSHLQGDFIITLHERTEGPGTSGWCCTNYDMYVKLNPLADKLEVEAKMLSVRNELVVDLLREVGKTGLEDMLAYQSYYLQPVGNIYLNPEQVGDYLAHGSKEMSSIFGIIAITILLLACVNFINLSTAKSLKRSKEVGLKKVVGSFRSSLVYQYLLESCFYTFLAVIIGVAIAWLSLAPFNQLAGTQLTMPWYSNWFVPSMLALSLVIGTLSGLYPAFYLTAIQPIQALRGADKKRDGTSLIRNVLVVFQFSATIILIISALVIHDQFMFLMNKSLGYDREQVIHIEGLETMDKEKRQTFKKELLSLTSVSSATLSDYLPVEGGKIQNRSFWTADKQQSEDGFEAARWEVDEDYMKTLSIELVQGRDFDKRPTDDQSIIINESMVERLGLQLPIGVEVVDMFDEKYTIIGVVNDFYFESLFGEVRPLAMVRESGVSTLSVRLDATNIEPAIASIIDVWNKLTPDQAFRYSFLDQRFEQMYDILSRAKTIFLLFAVLSIIIACLGLFALSVHLVEQRGKEISIRKVLGANVGRILVLLNINFIKLIMIAMLIAIPFSMYFTEYLLEEMANHINLSWYTVAIATGIVMFIAVITVSFESVKAAFINPVDGLRNE